MSDYERVRLENIRRNAAFLSGIGIQDQTKLISTGSSKATAVPTADKKVVPKRKRDEKSEPVKRETPTRFSLRVRQVKPDYKELKESDVPKQPASNVTDDSEESAIDYTYIPREPNLLDDFEFEIYVQLKKWRLLKSREKELEAYKIFHNDTFCDMIRRKRNDRTWGNEVNNEGGNNSEEDRSRQLQECYGVGPSKSRIDPKGLALECLELIELPENIEKLEESRKLT